MSRGKRITNPIAWDGRTQDNRPVRLKIEEVADQVLAPVAARVDALEVDVADHETRITAVEAWRSQATTALVGNQVAIPSSTSLLRANNATLLTIQGIAAGIPGQRLTIVSVGTGHVDVWNDDAAAAAGNRVLTRVVGALSLAAGVGRITLEYDSVSQRWRVVHHEQGTELQPPYSAADFTAAGGGTWTVPGGSVVASHYRRRGREMKWNVFLINTTVTGVVTELRVALPPGITTARSALIPCRHGDAGVLAPQIGFIEVRSTYLAIGRNDGTAFPPGSQTYVQGQVQFETN